MKPKISIPLSVLFILFSTLNSVAQSSENSEKLLQDRIDSFYTAYPQEKVYLHFDRPSYWANDDIWFKAYLLNSPTNENNLYVELLNPDGEILQKKMYWASNGLAYGDFHLPDTTSSGVYQIRAYTNWMRNFSDERFFRKDLVIWNLAFENEKEVLPLKKKQIDVQFFPEGGTFIANIPNRVAFKAVDNSGRGVDVKGDVYDSGGNAIVSFESLHNGMGSFIIQPQPGQKYTAEIVVEEEVKLSEKLPEPETNGVALAVQSASNGSLYVQIASSGADLNSGIEQKFIIAGQSNNRILFTKTVVLENGVAILKLDKKTLPTGILQLTLFNTSLLPLCERLVFIKHNDFITVNIEPEKLKYKTREKVVLNLQSTDNSGKPCITNLSLSAANATSYLSLEKYPNHILSHFLLTSELKGVVEEPGYYFKDDSLATLLALDHLLMTQGWRQFEWKKILSSEKLSLNYQHESSIVVKGSIQKFLVPEPLPFAKISLMFINNDLSLEKQLTAKAISEKFKVYEQTADSLGNFKFDEFYFNDTLFVSIQALNEKGKNNSWVDIDNRSWVSPIVKYLPPSYLFSKGKTYKTTTYLSEINSELISRKWHLSDTILLGDINVMASRVAPGDGHIRLYEKADFVINVAKMDDAVGGVFDYISEGKIPGVYGNIEDNSIRIRGNQEAPLFLLDGFPVEADMLETMSVGLFDKIEVLKFANMYGSRGNNGAILFFTKPGGPEIVSRDAKGMKSGMVIGYSVIRQFYSPKYENKSGMKNDFRSTLYWNPIVQTTPTGEAQVDFYSSDQAGDVEVVVEGISNEGKLCRGKAVFNVTY